VAAVRDAYSELDRRQALDAFLNSDSAAAM
jgi:hypothetical protein